MSQQINLFNPLFLRQKKVFSARAMLQGLCAIAAGALLLYGYAAFQTRSIERVLQETERRLEERRGQLVRLTQEYSPQGRSRLLEDELARVEARLKRRSELLKALTTGVAGDTKGYSEHLSALARQRIEGVWLTGVAISPTNSVTLKGRALNAELVPAYLRQLNKEPAFAGRSVAELKIAAKTEEPKVAAPGAKTNGAAPSARAAPPPTPSRYLEFDMSLPLVAEAEESADPGRKAKPGRVPL